MVYRLRQIEPVAVALAPVLRQGRVKPDTGHAHALTLCLLVFAVVAETIGTSALHASQQFTRLGPSLLVIAAYATSFYLLSLTLKTMPVGIMYALWSGCGIILIALIGWLVFRQALDWPAVLGMTLIILGIVVIQLFSKTATH